MTLFGKIRRFFGEKLSHEGSETLLLLIFFEMVMLFAVWNITDRHIENISNTKAICERMGIEYCTKTNMVSGLETRIYVIGTVGEDGNGR